MSGPSVEAIEVDPQPALRAWIGEVWRGAGWLDRRSAHGAAVTASGLFFPSESRISVIGPDAARGPLSRVAGDRKARPESRGGGGIVEGGSFRSASGAARLRSGSLAR